MEVSRVRPLKYVFYYSFLPRRHMPLKILQRHNIHKRPVQIHYNIPPKILHHKILPPINLATILLRDLYRILAQNVIIEHFHLFFAFLEALVGLWFFGED